MNFENDYEIKTFANLPSTPAGRLDFVLDIASPHVDPETGEIVPPLITIEEAEELLRSKP